MQLPPRAGRLARAISVLALISATLLGLGTAAQAAADRGPAVHCQSSVMAVALAEGQPANQTIEWRLCTPPAQWHDTRAVDVLVHGATYDDDYWDPQGFPAYSFVRRDVTEGHRAVFVYGRLGMHGRAKTLPSTSVTLRADAYVLHQVLGWLKYHKGYRTVNVAGHSYGGRVTQLETSLWNDASRISLTVLHSAGPAVLGGEIPQVPANGQSRFAGYDSGWMTTPVGYQHREPFYNLAIADLRMLKHDEAAKDVVSATEFADGRAQGQQPPGNSVMNQIRVPVQLIVGTQDRLYCRIVVNGVPVGSLDCSNPATIRAFELPWYTRTPHLVVNVVVGSGHDLNLNSVRTSADAFRQINRFFSVN